MLEAPNCQVRFSLALTYANAIRRDSSRRTGNDWYGRWGGGGRSIRVHVVNQIAAARPALQFKLSFLASFSRHSNNNLHVNLFDSTLESTPTLTQHLEPNNGPLLNSNSQSTSLAVRPHPPLIRRHRTNSPITKFTVRTQESRKQHRTRAHASFDA